MMEREAKFSAGFFAEAGTKSTSKGYFGSVEQAGLACWIVAERIDAYEPKDSAKIAVDRIISRFNRNPSIAKVKIREYLYEAHQKLINESKTEMLKTSLIMVVTDYSKVVWAVVGNVRLYLFREGQLNFRSKDQTIAQVMVDSGLLDEDEVNGREERNNLINYLGGINDFNPLISEPFRLQDGDVMLLCNSGLWEKMKNRELADVVGQTTTPQEFLPKLKETMLLKDSTRLKNYTVGAIFAKKVITDNHQKNIPVNFKLPSDLVTKFVSKISARRFWLNISAAKIDFRKFWSQIGRCVKEVTARSFKEWLTLVKTEKIQPDKTIFKTDRHKVITRNMQGISELIAKLGVSISAIRIKLDLEFIKKIIVFCLLILLIIGFGWVTNQRVAATRTQNKRATEYRIKQKTLTGHTQSAERLTKTAQLMAAGDKYIAEGEFTAALKEYAKASSGAEENGYLKNELTKKISWAQQMIDLLSLDQAGDREAESQNYKVARNLYQSAQMVASRISNRDFMAILTAKLNDVSRKID